LRAAPCQGHELCPRPGWLPLRLPQASRLSSRSVISVCSRVRRATPPDSRGAVLRSSR
jgi:hypothetical protein